MTITLKAKARNDHRRSATKKFRREGFVPAVVYGKDKETKSVAVNSIELVKTVRDEGRNAIISLDIENDEQIDVMLHDYQMDPIKDELLHADFYIVDMSEEMDVEVALRLEGEPQGATEGGILQQPLYALQVRAKPGDIPEEITVDVSSLAIGDSIAVSDLPKAQEYEILDDADATIATVLPPEDAVEPADTSEEAQEPELVGADEKDKEHEE